MHKSVLLEECLQCLNLNNKSIIVDCTLGYGGHSSEILKVINNGHLYCFDQDEDAIKFSQERLNHINHNFTIIKSNFVNLKDKLDELNVEYVDGILFDLGVSSPQLDNSKRGFSFHNDAKLDMRMDKDKLLTAKDVVNKYDYKALVRIFKEYGEEKYASSIARGIIKYREEKEIETTLELVDIIKNNVPMKYSREKHPARKVFQAIRIEVNNELEVFEKALEQALELINVNGRICVITFHSLEDKICKNIFKKYSMVSRELAKLPIIPEDMKPKYKIIGTFEPQKKELEENNRARSAKLRVIERIKK